MYPEPSFRLLHKIPEELLFTAPQYNLWIELLYEPTQEKVLQYARKVLDLGMPPGVIMIDDNWHEPYGTWVFHSGRFPDPARMVQELHAMGLGDAMGMSVHQPGFADVPQA